jgi:uncharacterized protein
VNFIYDAAMGTFPPVMRVLAGLLDKAVAHAEATKGNVAALLDAKLAPDMFPLMRQVQVASDHAKGAAARLAGQTPPRFEDTEKTVAELKARIARTIEFVETFSAADFAGAAERIIRLPLQGSVTLEMTGEQFLRDWSLPNFYFHVTMAYAILRANGVPIGKQDFMGHIGYAIRKTE